ncbi:MAG TPA: transcriptional repressor LexA [Armatimonadota bacterium]|jgi:3'-5' exoribonuclease
MAGIRVIDLVDGDMVDDEFGVVERSRPTGKNGEPYALLEIRDATGSISAKQWKVGDTEWNRIASANCVHIRGHVQLYNGKLGIIADWIRPGADPNRTDGFIPEFPGDREAMWKAFCGLAHTVKDPNLVELLRRVFKLPGFTAAFRQATAAQKMHHVGVGGLLAHTLEVCDLCMAVCERAPGLRRDLLLTGAILHDIGKTGEMDIGRADFGTTVEGGLVGHVVMGAAMVQRVIEGIPDFPPNLRAAVLHLILTHQGTREWGAPMLPAIPEAVVLHACDNVSAKMDEFASAKGQAVGDSLFSRARGIENRVYVGEIELTGGDGATPSHWTLDDDEETGRPVLRIVAGGLSSDESLPEMAALPILGSIAAGIPISAQEHVNGYFAMPIDARGDAGDFLLKVTGDSMRDAHVLDGDLLRIRPLEGEPREGEIIAALLNGEVTVKRLHRSDDGVILHPENPEFGDIPVGATDDFQIQGRVVGLIRDRVQ